MRHEPVTYKLDRPTQIFTSIIDEAKKMKSLHNLKI